MKTPISKKTAITLTPELKRDLKILAAKADKYLKIYIEDELAAIVARARKKGML